MSRQLKMLTQSSLLRGVLLGIFVVAAIGLSSCGGGGGGGGGEPPSTWVRIDSPMDGDVTFLTTVLVKGNAVLNGAGAISWHTNNGASGTFTLQTTCIVGCITAFEGTVPLAVGTNLITVSLADGASDSVTVTRRPLVAVKGRVTMTTTTGAFVPDVTVTLAGDRNATIRVYGEYYFNNIQEGSYSVAPSLVPPQSTGCLSFSPPNRNFTVTALSDQDIGGLDFVATQLMPCFRVSGVLTSIVPEVGQGGTMVVLKDVSGNEYVVYSYSSGGFTFYHLPPGTYTVTPLGGTFEPAVSTVTVTNADVWVGTIKVVN